MYQEESIYNLLPSQNILPEKERMYHSKYPAWIAPTASTFILQNTSYPGVANTGGCLRYPRGAHPIYGNWRSMGLPKGGYKINPEKFYRKNHQYKILPPPVEKFKSDEEVKKPAIINVKEKPIMGLKSQKNYVTANAIDNILMEPRKRKIPNEKDLDYFLTKKDYGRIPNYLKRARSANQRNLDEKLRVQNENERYRNKMKKVLDNNELQLLREGLIKKLDDLQKQYGKISHRNKFDTLVSKNYKESLEREMEQVKKDLDSISKDIVTVDMTK